jgi:hypothetical protein
MRKMKVLVSVVLPMVGLIAVAGIVYAQSGTQRDDCPGTISCPLTGEVVCRDKCPTTDPNRPDCPGRILCPLTGELVCKDRCPMEKSAETNQAKLPSCCAKKG